MVRGREDIHVPAEMIRSQWLGGAVGGTDGDTDDEAGREASDNVNEQPVRTTGGLD